MGDQSYEYLKSIHRCIKCHTRDEHTLSGRTLCAKCAKAACEYAKKRYTKDEAFRRRKYELHMKYYNERKAKHLCVRCGKETDHRHVYCDECREKDKARRSKKTGERDPNMCSTCNKAPHLPGYKVCASCYEQILEHQKKAMDAIRRKSKNADAACDG